MARQLEPDALAREPLCHVSADLHKAFSKISPILVQERPPAKLQLAFFDVNVALKSRSSPMGR